MSEASLQARSLEISVSHPLSSHIYTMFHKVIIGYIAFLRLKSPVRVNPVEGESHVKESFYEADSVCTIQCIHHYTRNISSLPEDVAASKSSAVLKKKIRCKMHCKNDRSGARCIVETIDHVQYVEKKIAAAVWIVKKENYSKSKYIQLQTSSEETNYCNLR
ncbi:hypothetical protein TNCT_133781 [Trichonephila clavata]|uniref:Uncharacterized protein n=1 Tax=Trichonephila clavata TaxID=2740835 RepID=A0A8X6L872_TRICU|nr:hypothetical protein TNCT_133781 [Trichonephila clavata]